ncbi:hypothetical protein OG874_00530 [Nocardia sp. NBC_00565]|uniref:hypothetical protein n=1 Tax=Nocardia sp. NBC_00565 TaxID=2975993 RepID=UPI002E80BDA8|nr:hypothetical protein [Nocardia sp. NBC_00565]WUC03741.1 hypothetical protein OG874_00530 [Nocardia sp. NBC_00565]
MAAFASTTELQNWLQLSSIDTNAATLAVNVASSAIRSFCGWEITELTVAAEVMDGTGGRSLWLPTLRLTAVASVVENGNTLTVVTDYDWTKYGRLIRAGCWPRTARSVTITYTHGYATVPDVVKGMCLMLASRLYNNPEALKSQSETWGPFAESASFADGSGPGLSVQEMEILGPFKLEHVG